MPRAAASRSPRRGGSVFLARAGAGLDLKSREAA